MERCGARAAGPSENVYGTQVGASLMVIYHGFEVALHHAAAHNGTPTTTEMPQLVTLALAVAAASPLGARAAPRLLQVRSLSSRTGAACLAIVLWRGCCRR